MQDFQTHPPQLKQCITKKLSPMPTHRGTGKRDGAVRRLSKPVGFEQNCEMKGGLHTTVWLGPFVSSRWGGFMRCADGAVQPFQGDDDVQRNNTRGISKLTSCGKRSGQRGLWRRSRPCVWLRQSHWVWEGGRQSQECYSWDTWGGWNSSRSLEGNHLTSHCYVQ